MNCYKGFFNLLNFSGGIKLIPREYLYSNPNGSFPKISPDGKHLAFLAPRKGVMNIFVCLNSYDVDKAKVITCENRRIVEYYWTYDNNYILYSYDKDGCEEYKIYIVNIITTEMTCLTPYDNVRSMFVQLSPKNPNRIIVAINKPNPNANSLYQINYKTGVITLIEENTQFFEEYTVDDSLKIRCAKRLIKKKDKKDKINEEVCIKDENSNKWRSIITYGIKNARSLKLISIDDEGTIYLVDSRRNEFSAICKLNTSDKELRTEFARPQNQKADINKILLHPKTKKPIAYSVTYLKDKWYCIDEKISYDLDFLRKFNDGELDILSQSLDNKIWTVAFESGNQPPKYYLYNRDNRSINHLFDAYPKLEKYVLAQVFPLVIKSRDDLDLVCYLTLPAGKYDPSTEYKPKKPLPLILHVHGGPWTRDYYGFKADSQFFANRGYAVLNVNYRSSVGLGRSLICAGVGQWGKKMNDDLIDAAKWAISEKIAIKEKIAIYGGSYGGFATLAGLALTNKNENFTFACGVEFSGPSDLDNICSVLKINNPIRTIPSYWKPSYDEFIYRLGGDPDTVKGLKYLQSCSPSNYADNINKPLLIAQGKNDPRVKYEEKNIIAKTLKHNKIPVGYILYCDEGHGFAKPENMLSFVALKEKFLSECLGGKCEAPQLLNHTK
ncbi:629_t:CDS:2 [Dentiscutata erythropus]|uniref:Dipeptidyl-peptidase V n=1 Tax=Dentiscutata erythropus TaxID=1348616 RepID=A0A9N9C251_9GLOM|nr:629_t:CDS:2 [Dentiscutata erythropus]